MKKQYIDVFDIMAMFDCCEARAYKILREIKGVSDTLHMAGKVTTADYERWYITCGGRFPAPAQKGA